MGDGQRTGVNMITHRLGIRNFPVHPLDRVVELAAAGVAYISRIALPSSYRLWNEFFVCLHAVLLCLVYTHLVFVGLGTHVCRESNKATA